MTKLVRAAARELDQAMASTRLFVYRDRKLDPAACTGGTSNQTPNEAQYLSIPTTSRITDLNSMRMGAVFSTTSLRAVVTNGQVQRATSETHLRSLILNLA